MNYQFHYKTHIGTSTLEQDKYITYTKQKVNLQQQQKIILFWCPFISFSICFKGNLQDEDHYVLVNTSRHFQLEIYIYIYIYILHALVRLPMASFACRLITSTLSKR